MSLVPFLLIEDVQTGGSVKYPVLRGKGSGLSLFGNRCTLLPKCIELTVKDIKTLSDGRFAISVKGAAVTQLSGGASIVAYPALPWFSGRFFLHIQEQIPRGVCVLTSPLFGRRRYTGKLDRRSGLPCFLASEGQRIPVAPGFPVQLETTRGRRISAGTVLASVPEKSREKGKRGEDRPISDLPAGETISPEALLRVAFSLQGYAVWRPGAAGADAAYSPAGMEPPRDAKSVGAAGTAGKGKIRQFPLEGGALCFASPRFLADCARSLKRWSMKPGGTKVIDAAAESGIPPAVLRGVLRSFAQAGRSFGGNGERERCFPRAACLSGDHILPASMEVPASLSPVSRGILVSLEKAGTGGEAIAAFRNPPFDKEIRNLERLRLVERRGGFYFLPASLAEAEAAIRGIRAEGKTADPPAVAEVLSVSRARASAILRGMTEARERITE
jgi:hypothetical protein